MPPIDVLKMVKNLDQRTSAIEQILPTLATKEDLKAFATKEDLNEKFEEAKRFALVLHEDLKGDIALIAEHLSDVMTRLSRRHE
jgi:hypothetical protein